MKKRSVITLALTGVLCLVSQTQSFAQQPQPADQKADQKTEPQKPSDVDVSNELEQLEAEVGAKSGDKSAPSTASQVAQSVGAAVQSMNPDISFILDLAAAYFSDTPAPLGGPNPSVNGFNLQGLEMAVYADVDPYFRFASAIVLHQDGVEVEEAFGSTLALPYQLGVRFGQYKTFFGRQNASHLHTWAFVDEPLVNAKLLGPESMRGLGAEVSQLVLWMPGTFRWFASYQNITGRGSSPAFVPDGGVQNWGDLVASGRIEDFFDLSENWDLLLGASYANGPDQWGTGVVNPDTGELTTHVGSGDRSQIVGIDTFLKWRSLSSGGRSQLGWQTEAMLRRRQVPGGTLEDYGLYSWLEFSPNRYWSTAVRYDYVSGIDPSTDGGALFGNANQAGLIDPLHPQWTKARQRGSVDVSWFPSHFSKLRLQYNLDYMPWRTGSADKIVHTVMLQAELVTGAHGAHAY